MTPEQAQERLAKAVQEGKLLPSARQNCLEWLAPQLFEDWVVSSILELIELERWDELNDRFYKTLAFGTGGLRGRTIGKTVTKAEQGLPGIRGCPEHAAVGSNCMNDFNVRRATMGLIAYIRKVGSLRDKPRVVFGHDTRHFSRHFAEIAAHTIVEAGGRALLFESERSTPEVSFAIRMLGADAGVVITASHNPPYDNGYKAYFRDGAQVIEPHAGGIIREVHATTLQQVVSSKKESAPYELIGPEVDQAYQERLRTLILEPEVVRRIGPSVKVVFSPLHGTGMKMIPHILEEMGLRLLVVPEQAEPDGRFPTVKSPNPENAEALSLGIQLADRHQADVILATDPDADRMGAAVRNAQGKMELLNGNQIGSLLAFYRLERLFDLQILNSKNRDHTVLIKTVVTTDLQAAIARHFGVQITETLTGFKFIGEKLRKYEEQACRAASIDPLDYRKLSEPEKRALLLTHARYYVFGGEESYGYSASDFCRDKDANAACIMFAELAAFLKTRNQSVLDYLDSIYRQLGYFHEKLGQLVYEGAEGATKIKKILDSYQDTPPQSLGDFRVLRSRNFAKEDIRDTEGDLLPKEMLFFIELEGGFRYAVRGSGTEPKIKFYLFAQTPPLEGTYSKDDLAEIKSKTTRSLDLLWKTIEADARKRAAA